MKLFTPSFLPAVHRGIREERTIHESSLAPSREFAGHRSTSGHGTRHRMQRGREGGRSCERKQAKEMERWTNSAHPASLIGRFLLPFARLFPCPPLPFSVSLSLSGALLEGRANRSIDSAYSRSVSAASRVISHSCDISYPRL